MQRGRSRRASAATRRAGLIALGLMSAPLLAAPSADPRITDIVPIHLHPGINHVPGFLPDGHAATIIEGWRGNGNAHGHHAWMVLTGPSEGFPVGLAPIEQDGGLVSDTLSDDPFDGERVLGVVRFARARIDGQPASIVISAHLDWTPGRPLADHEKATITLYRLTSNGDGVGPPLSFVPVTRLHSDKRYCTVELALRDVLGLALQADYAAPNRLDGCF